MAAELAAVQVAGALVVAAKVQVETAQAALMEEVVAAWGGLQGRRADM
jgi:hypothetical protein